MTYLYIGMKITIINSGTKEVQISHIVKDKKQEAFQEYVKSIKRKVGKEYIEIAQKFAKIIGKQLILE